MLRRAYSSSASRSIAASCARTFTDQGRIWPRICRAVSADGHGKAQAQAGDRVELGQRADDDHVVAVRPASDR